MGYGYDAYGTGGYGLGAPLVGSPFAASAAEGIATRTVQVTFSAPPMAKNSSNAGDALNPASYVVTRLDTGQVLTTLSVTQVSPTVYNVATLESFGPATAQHQLFVAGVFNKLATIYASQFLNFSGVVAFDDSTPERQAGARRYSSIDLANPPVAFGSGGTLIVTAGGDYATVTGPELVKKLILRRLSTRKAELWYLPDYGLGFDMQAPINVGLLPKMKAEIERQIREEPEVDDVQAVLFGNNDGTVYLQLQARLRQTGETISISYPNAPNLML